MPNGDGLGVGTDADGAPVEPARQGAQNSAAKTRATRWRSSGVPWFLSAWA